MKTTEWTMEKYKASQERAKKMIELMETNPEEATKQALASWEPTVKRINQWIEKNK